MVYKVDRLSRSLLDFARIMEVFEQHNVSFVSVTQQFNTTHSMGRLTLNILLSFALFEREIIGERIRDKIAAQRRKGKWAGGMPVLGYDVDRSDASPKLVVNAEQSARVRQIFELYLEEKSLLPVVKELSRRGWANKSWLSKKGRPMGGLPFDKCSLHRLLTNPLYIGKIRHKDEIFDGEHEAIVDADVFQKVQRRLKRNGRSASVRNKHGALLKGLLHCQSCGRAMTHTFTAKRNKRYRYYACTQAIKKGRAACPSKYLPAAQIEAAVIDEIRGIGRDPALLGKVYLHVQAQDKSRQKVLRREQAGLRRELTRHDTKTADQLADGRTGAPQEVDRSERAKKCLGELRRQIANVEHNEITQDQVDAVLCDFDTLWKSLKSREQAELLQLLVAKAEFNAEDSSLTIQFHPMVIKELACKP